MKSITTHTVHESTHPAYSVARSKVQNVPWAHFDLGYSPAEFTHTAVIANDETVQDKGWADPNVLTKEFVEEKVWDRSTYTTEDGKLNRNKYVMYQGFKVPCNPVGRTGMTGRGLLGKYGANFAADPLVTRNDPESGMLQMVAIKRGDTGDWAIPGGMVDPNEEVTVTLKREFGEEALDTLGGEGATPEEKAERKAKVDEMLNETFKDGKVVYRGYVDDPRNTDIAWMETTCVHFHLKPEMQLASFTLKAGDDAAKVAWIDISDAEPRFVRLYASHKQLVMDAINLMYAREDVA